MSATTTPDWARIADLAARGYNTIDTQVWEKDLERPGYLKLIRTKPVREVYEELKGFLGHVREDIGGGWYGRDGEGLGEYFSLIAPADKEWPVNSRVVVFAVRGGSEGDYIHVEAVSWDNRCECLMLGKGFAGRDAAWLTARRIADLLGV